MGDAVGLEVGKDVGAPVGEVGVDVGVVVGDTDGVVDGTSVGDDVGDSVHALQCPGQYPATAPLASRHPPNRAKSTISSAHRSGSGPWEHVGEAVGALEGSAVGVELANAAHAITMTKHTCTHAAMAPPHGVSCSHTVTLGSCVDGTSYLKLAEMDKAQLS